jgi:hypothetical protein
MSENDYVPSSDSAFDLWQKDLMSALDDFATTWGIPEASVKELNLLKTNWEMAFTKTSNKNNRTLSQVQAKTDARKPYEKKLRKFVAQWLAYNDKVSDSDRENMGLTIKSETHTPVSDPTTFPSGKIDFSVSQQHTIHYVDSETGGKAKPKGVHGCELWMKTGPDAPKDDSEYKYVAIKTKTPHVVTYNISEIGKTIFYRMRWTNKRGKPGPWSPPISASIAG